MYRIEQIKLGLSEPKDKIPEKISKKLGVKGLNIKEWRIVKESLDARDKSSIKWIYTVDFAADRKLKLATAPEGGYELPEASQEALKRAERGERPVVVGFGPAGIFASLIFAQAGLKPVIIERGKRVEERARDVEGFWAGGPLNPDSNVQFGEGGAGAFSDGKLTTGIKDIRIKKVLEELVRFGAPEEIMYKQKPHVGTDILRTVVKNMREEIIRLGGEIRFETKASSLLIGQGRIKGLVCIDKAGVETAVRCEHIVFAMGHSARDTFSMFKEKGILMEQKPFSIGVRVEHPQDMVDIGQYGSKASQLGLPPAEYKLSYRCKGSQAGRGVYTFCMCPGGQVINASSEAGGVAVNGMSLHARDSGRANSALLCDVRVSDFGSDDVLAGVEFQKRYEKKAFIASGGRQVPPACSWGEFKNGKASGVVSCIPDFAAEAILEAMPQLGKKLKGFDSEDTKIYAVETRSSSPVRILRGKDGQSLSALGLYPCGEGAGYAGGITSAAVDGISSAEAVIKSL